MMTCSREAGKGSKHHAHLRAIGASLAILLCSAGAAPALQASDPIASDWRDIPDDEILVMQLPGDRRVVIRLAPRFAPDHVFNVRALAHAHWWDEMSVYRAQDNWVVQWGKGDSDKPLPTGVLPRGAEDDFSAMPLAQTLSRADAYSEQTGITADGWPLAEGDGKSWLPHCYGVVGVVHGPAPDSGSGEDLFAVIGGSGRTLDRAYPVVGRVIEGMEYLSALPRSRAPLGFYATPAEWTKVTSIRLADDMLPEQRPHYQFRSADNARFKAAIAERRHPKPPQIDLGGVDVCDIPLEVRATPR